MSSSAQPPAEPSPPTDHNQHGQDQPQPELLLPQQRKKEIKTFHCRYCSHLLLASTRSILSPTEPLARRAGGSGDRALILDITIPARRGTLDKPEAEIHEDEKEEEETAAGIATATAAAAAAEESTTTIQKGQGNKKEEAHYTIPLSTLVPDSKPVVIRRDDGFEKRVLFKCGRCRVVVGYEIVPKQSSAQTQEQADEEENEGRVMYILPGSLVGTDDLQGESPVVKQMETEWARWITV